MANPDLVNAFNDCIDRIINGQSIEECLRLYPQYREMLRPMLEAGRVVQRVGINASETAQAQSRVRNRIQQAIQTSPKRISYPFRRFAALAASFLLIFAVTAAYTQHTLPGDTFYDFKLFTENVQLSLSRDAGNLKQQFASRRISEIQQLLTIGRTEIVTFEGMIVAQNDLLWQVANLTVEVSNRVVNVQSYKVGDVIRVDGLTTAQGTVLASQLVLIEAGAQIIPSPIAPLATPIPSATASFTATATLLPSSTPALQPSATMTPTATVTPTATSIPPTATIRLATATATVCTPTQPDGWIVYRVRAGDTLSQLATSSGITLTRLMSVNCLNDASRIVVEEQLYLPRPITPNPTAASGQSTTVPPAATDDHGGDSNTGNSSDDDGTDDHSGHGNGSDDG